MNRVILGSVNHFTLNKFQAITLNNDDLFIFNWTISNKKSVKLESKCNDFQSRKSLEKWHNDRRVNSYFTHIAVTHWAVIGLVVWFSMAAAVSHTNTVRLIFLEFSRKTHYSSSVWGNMVCLCRFNLSFIILPRHCSDVCNLFLYWTAF